MPPDMFSTASIASQRQAGAAKMVAQRLCGPIVSGPRKHKTVSFEAHSSEETPGGALTPNVSTATAVLQEAAEMERNASYMKAVAAMVIEILKTTEFSVVKEMTALTDACGDVNRSYLADVGNQFRDLERTLRSATEALVLRCPKPTGGQSQLAPHTRAVRMTVDTHSLRIKKAFAHLSMGVDLVNTELHLVRNRLLQSITTTKTLCSHVQLTCRRKQASNMQNLGLFPGHFIKWKEATEHPGKSFKLCTNIHSLYDRAQGFRFLGDLYRKMKDSSEAHPCVAATTPWRSVPSGAKLPERDSPNNPFLIDLPSLPIKQRTSTPRAEKPTMTYVFRGNKQEFQNPYYGASAVTYAVPEVSVFQPCRLFEDELQRRAAQFAIKSVASKLTRAPSPDLWDSDGEDEFMALPRLRLAEVLEKVAAAAARPTKPLPVRKRVPVRA